MKATAVLSLCLLFAGCVVAPKDPFVAARRALDRADLAGALLAYDAVPVTHARYPEARAAAADIEQRMRRSLELVLEALMLRGEWQDQEALEALRRARDFWREQPGLEQLTAATERRLALLEREAEALPAAPTEPAAMPLIEVAPPEVPLPIAAPVVAPMPAPVAAAQPAPEPLATESSLPAAVPAPAPPPSPVRPEPSLALPVAVAPVASAAAPAPPAAASPTVAPLGEEVAQGLLRAEARLTRGDTDVAVADLVDLARRFPAEDRVRVRLVRLLHQRALRRYGEGAVESAINDWERILQLDANDKEAQQGLAVARAERSRR